MNSTDSDKNTPLHWACQENHYDILSVLMSRGAEKDPLNAMHSTPLHYACLEGNIDIVSALINFGSDLELRTKVTNGG